MAIGPWRVPLTLYSSQLFAVFVWGNFSLGFLIGVLLGERGRFRTWFRNWVLTWVLLGIQLTAPVVGLIERTVQCISFNFIYFLA